jgi:hypothetical protein
VAHFIKPGHNTVSQVVGYKIFTSIIFLVLISLPVILSSIAASARYFHSLLRPDRCWFQPSACRVVVGNVSCGDESTGRARGDPYLSNLWHSASVSDRPVIVQ